MRRFQNIEVWGTYRLRLVDCLPVFGGSGKAGVLTLCLLTDNHMQISYTVTGSKLDEKVVKKIWILKSLWNHFLFCADCSKTKLLLHFTDPNCELSESFIKTIPEEFRCCSNISAAKDFLVEQMSVTELSEMGIVDKIKGKNPSTITGCSHVANLWHASIVCIFLKTLSSLLPKHQVHIENRTGEFILPYYLVYENGETRVDDDLVKEELKELERDGMRKQIAELGERVDQAKRGVFYADAPIKDFKDQPEVDGLLKSAKRNGIEIKTILQAAKHVVLPGDGTLVNVSRL